MVSSLVKEHNYDLKELFHQISNDLHCSTLNTDGTQTDVKSTTKVFLGRASLTSRSQKTQLIITLH